MEKQLNGIFHADRSRRIPPKMFILQTLYFKRERKTKNTSDEKKNSSRESINTSQLATQYNCHIWKLFSFSVSFFSICYSPHFVIFLILVCVSFFSSHSEIFRVEREICHKGKKLHKRCQLDIEKEKEHSLGHLRHFISLDKFKNAQ